jgi:hypothetical protein
MKLPPIPPNIEDPAISAYLRSLSLSVEQHFRNTVTTETAVGSVLLVSPGGKVYTVQVDDAGNVTTEYVAG